jgi:hypothetical protein
MPPAAARKTRLQIHRVQMPELRKAHFMEIAALVAVTSKS